MSETHTSAHPGPVATVSLATATVAPTWLPSAAAVTDGPVASRRLYLVAVPNCPYCGRMHHHRVGRAEDLYQLKTVKKCPVVKDEYILRPISRKELPSK
jgi:hypothetical protein